MKAAPTRQAAARPASPYADHIAALVAAAPPLTAEQEARIRGLFRSGTAPRPALPALPLAA